MGSKSERVSKSSNVLTTPKNGIKQHKNVTDSTNVTKSVLVNISEDIGCSRITNTPKRKRRLTSSIDELELEEKRMKSEISEHDTKYSPQLNKSENKDKNSEKTLKKRSVTNIEINSVNGEKLTSVENSESNNLELVASTSQKKKKQSRKSKGLSDAELQDRLEKQVMYLNSFAKTSLRYAEFLEQKIFSSELRDNNSSDDELTKNNTERKKSRTEVIESLAHFNGKLHPYQVEGVSWLTLLYENSVNGILADDMGLGKTIQIIALFCYLYEQNVKGPYLIVAPLSTLSNWQSEFAKFAPKIPVIVLHGDPEERDKIKRFVISSVFKLDGRIVKPVIVCNYEMILMEQVFLEKFTWQYIVVDEGHKIKNPEARISQELRALRSINRTLLTGTPLQNNIKELWSLFNFLLPELFDDIEGFSSLLQLEDMKDTNQLLVRESKTKVISTIHKVLAPFMLRREKQLVLDDLVPKKEVIIYCSMTQWQKYLYRAILSQDYRTLMMLPTDETDLNDKRKARRSCRNKKIDYKDNVNEIPTHVKPAYMQLLERTFDTNVSRLVYKHKDIPFEMPECPYKCCVKLQHTVSMLKKAVSHPYLIWTPVDPSNKKQDTLFVDETLIRSSGKLMALDVLFPKLKADNHKVLVFSTMTTMLDMIEEMLLLRGHNYRRLDGAVKLQDRKNSIEEFTTDPSVFIFLLSTRAGGLGLNLTAADTVIFVDRDWNPMVDLQAQDRCHRIGQTKPVMVYSLITKNTIDEIILNCGDMKRRLEKIVIQEGKFSSGKKSLDTDELKELEDLLNDEDKLLRTRANGLIYTEKQLNQILDRTELYEQIEKRKLENEKKKQDK